MNKGRYFSTWAAAARSGGGILLGCPAAGPAQSEPSHSPGLIEQLFGGDPHGADRGESKLKAVAQPYDGQVYCPVTGTKLGLNQAPVPVQTTLGAEKPSRMGRLFGQKEKPGVVIYVSSPEFAEQVRQDPQPYLAQIILDKTTFPYTYAQAPAQRPAAPPVLHDGRPQAPESEPTRKSAAVPPSGTANP